MDDVSHPTEQQSDVPDPAIETGATFLRALFDESDTVLFRPIETWLDGGRKCSRVDYRNTYYRKIAIPVLKTTILQLLRLAERTPVNLFFGVCPRVGNKGRFDLAWQIRVVRALWADIDHVTVEEACARITQAGLPTPSIIVNSGNGVHLYWLLDAPYLIDDAGDPPPVETERLEMPGGRRKTRRYIVEDGDRVYLDQRRHASRLSAKAQGIQDLLAGIAKACGGDHTTDLSRLLRLPGTLNRKDQRNGREPVPTAMIECDPSRRYPLTAFQPFSAPSPETERRRQIARMPLPRPRKLSSTRGDKLDQLIAAASIAPAGGRSEADFAVCCFAIRNGVDKEVVWGQVEQVGKFAEKGRRYFDLTWDNAEFDVQASTFDKLRKGTTSKSKNAPELAGEDDECEVEPPPDAEDERGPSRQPVIHVDASTTPVGHTLHQVTDRLLATGNCFNRADQLVVVTKDTISAILSSQELAGLLNQYVEFYFAGEESGEYKPLPPAYGNTWLNQRVERGRMPTIKLFTRNPVYTQDWRLVAPGFDSQSGIYYAGLPVEARTGTEHLDAMLQDFCFRSAADRTNYLGMLLTAILIPRFIGSKPAALFNGNQPELGKSILAQIIAVLRDGHQTETASYNPNDEEFEKRLGAIVRRGVTTIIIDNAKAQGRNPRIESACLERSITDPILSFRLLGYSQEIRAENSHIFCITANTPDVSRDLVTRSVVINLYHEGDPKRRAFRIADPADYAEEHRIALLGELIGMVERWKASGMREASGVFIRFNKRGWGTTVGGILDACGEPDFLGNADEAAAQLDETRREFAELVSVLADHPQGTWTASELVELCVRHSLLASDLGEGSSRSLSTKMGTLAGRFVGESFPLVGRKVVFHRSVGRMGNIYRVALDEEVLNLEAHAEPLLNLKEHAGSAP